MSRIRINIIFNVPHKPEYTATPIFFSVRKSEKLAIVTYETATRSVAVDQQWTLYTTAPRRHATISFSFEGCKQKYVKTILLRNNKFKMYE
jgi:hypothetical protein